MWVLLAAFLQFANEARGKFDCAGLMTLRLESDIFLFADVVSPCFEVDV